MLHVVRNQRQSMINGTDTRNPDIYTYIVFFQCEILAMKHVRAYKYHVWAIWICSDAASKLHKDLHQPLDWLCVFSNALACSISRKRDVILKSSCQMCNRSRHALKLKLILHVRTTCFSRHLTLAMKQNWVSRQCALPAQVRLRMSTLSGRVGHFKMTIRTTAFANTCSRGLPHVFILIRRCTVGIQY